MKKVLSLVAVVALAASFTACKKDYTCDCVYTWSDGTTTDYSYEYLKAKKSDAEDWCDGINTGSYECELNS